MNEITNEITNNITNNAILDYLHAIYPEDEEPLRGIRKRALEEKIPIIRNEVKQLLEVLLYLQKPNNILEIGTAVGYSSLLMSQFLPEEGRITTLERWDEMIQKAKANIELVGKTDVITILQGDAEEILPTLQGTYDFIFMDAAKAQYITFLPHCMRLLRVGGVLVSDNVLQDGTIVKSRWSIPRRQRTIHARMRDYLWEINHHPQLKTVILPIADGLTISYKME